MHGGGTVPLGGVCEVHGGGTVHLGGGGGGYVRCTEGYSTPGGVCEVHRGVQYPWGGM